MPILSPVDSVGDAEVDEEVGSEEADWTEDAEEKVEGTDGGDCDSLEEDVIASPC